MTAARVALWVAFASAAVPAMAADTPVASASAAAPPAESAAPTPPTKPFKLAAKKKKSPASKGSSKIPALLQEVERQYSKAATLTADFSEVDEIAALDQKKKKSGRIRVRRPDKFRWEITQPDQSLLVSDGHKYWYYTPPFEEGEHGQVIEQPASQVQSRLLSALLTGSFSTAIHSLRIEQRGSAEFMMLPRHGSAGTVREALIQIDPERKLIIRVELLHEGGNRTVISLTEIKLGEKLSGDLFKFTPPPNTDKVSG